MEHFLRFVNKYVSRVVGNNTYARWKKSPQTKTLLDKILASDFAYTYTIFVYENSKEVWEEELIIKARAKTDEERKNAEWHHNPMYHEGRGKCLKIGGPAQVFPQIYFLGGRRPNFLKGWNPPKNRQTPNKERPIFWHDEDCPSHRRNFTIDL